MPTTSPGRLAVLLTITALALAAAGCGSGPGSGTGAALNDDPQAAAPAPGSAGCRPYSGPGVTLPEDAEPTSAERCTTRIETVPGDGAWSFEINERATDLDELMTAMRLPSEDRSTGACTQEIREPGVVLLEIGGTSVPVVTPKDGCGKPRPEVVRAWQDLRWHETGRSRLARQPATAATSTG
jgi:hypothetical protein